MLKAGKHPCLAPEPRQGRSIAEALIAKEFDRNLPVQFQIRGLIYNAHSALPDPALQPQSALNDTGTAAGSSVDASESQLGAPRS
jgi:hypothetical protein